MISPNNLTRRQFGLAVAGTLAASGIARPDAGSVPENDKQRLPRDVWVASVCLAGLNSQSPQEMCTKMLNRMEETTPYHPDIICTPEAFAFARLEMAGGKPDLSKVAERRTGPILERFADFARQRRCYVICCTYTKEGGHYYNAAVLFDREGRYVGEYHKIHPDGFDRALGVTPGPLEPPVFETDFGTIGMQICYDANWFDGWRRLSDAGARIVFWPSYFAGGMMLNSLAWMNKYYIASSIVDGDPTKIVNPLGEEIVATGRAANWVCTRLNLDYAIVQTMEFLWKTENIYKKYGRGFRIRILNVEALAMIEGVSADISVAQALKEFDIPTAQEMLAAATRAQNAIRPRE